MERSIAITFEDRRATKVEVSTSSNLISCIFASIDHKRSPKRITSCSMQKFHVKTH
ncbi:unnamed protein product [Cylicocyclus nassatus]|uniref:Uncharacterized protein n=1 Tax=Cylicocyclus nassatus TaxID=53992 RepID=A0AA36H9H1_CYLNA|nr:unnamed protein product [Cylicocyclus nassatus]